MADVMADVITGTTTTVTALGVDIVQNSISRCPNSNATSFSKQKGEHRSRILFVASQPFSASSYCAFPYPIFIHALSGFQFRNLMPSASATRNKACSSEARAWAAV